MSSVVLQRLQQRAIQAEQLITHLHQQVNSLKTSAAVELCKKEEVVLAQENERLRKDVAALKQRLVDVETQNGIVHIPLPVRKSAAAAAIVQAPAPVKVEKMAEEPAPAKSSKKEKAEKKKGTPGVKDEGVQKPGAEIKPIDVSRLDMRIGFIVSAKKHPDADGLYVEEVDLGEDRCRTIVSGLVKHIPLEKMQQRHAIFMVNLKPAKMRGILSEGMIMCGSSPEIVEIIEPPQGVVKGERVVVEGYTGTADPMLNPKKKIWEQVQPDLRINLEGVATFKGVPWKIEGHDELCKVPTMRDSIIK